jgi:hypothetical protein
VVGPFRTGLRRIKSHLTIVHLWNGRGVLSGGPGAEQMPRSCTPAMHGDDAPTRLTRVALQQGLPGPAPPPCPRPAARRRSGACAGGDNPPQCAQCGEGPAQSASLAAPSSPGPQGGRGSLLAAPAPEPPPRRHRRPCPLSDGASGPSGPRRRARAASRLPLCEWWWWGASHRANGPHSGDWQRGRAETWRRISRARASPIASRAAWARAGVGRGCRATGRAPGARGWPPRGVRPLGARRNAAPSRTPPSAEACLQCPSRTEGADGGSGAQLPGKGALRYTGYRYEYRYLNFSRYTVIRTLYRYSRVVDTAVQSSRSSVRF